MLFGAAAAAAAAAARALCPPTALPPSTAPRAQTCAEQYGRECVAATVDPACPAVFRDSGSPQWMVRTDAEAVCSADCLRALCGLQAERERLNETRGPACADAELEMLIRRAPRAGRARAASRCPITAPHLHAWFACQARK